MDREVERLYRVAGVRGMVSPGALARRLLGPSAIRVAHAAGLPGDAALVCVHGEWRIYLRGRLSAQRATFAIAHELAHWALGPEATEEDCDALAAALVVPRRAFLRALRAHRYHIAELARVFDAAQSLVALRLGEVTGDPVALITRARVLVRGSEWAWPPERELRRLASSPVPGVRVEPITDASGRIVVFGEE